MTKVCLTRRLYECAGAAMIMYHRPGSLNNGNAFPHSSGGWKSEMEVFFSLTSMVFPIHVSVLIASSSKNTRPVGLGPSLMTLMSSLKSLSPNTF